MTENVTTPPVPQEDNLATDLLQIITGTNTELGFAPLDPKYVDAVMQKLVPYLVERDHKILTHGYDAGRASA